MGKICLGDKELDRLLMIEQVKARLLTQEEAGNRLGISSRQVRRILKSYSASGAKGITSQHKGGNRAFGSDFKEQVLSCIKEKYLDFGPAFASEKLMELEGLRVNRETLRTWMIESGLWKGRSRKKARIHQSRERRARFGELVQIDGSHHDWFEGRAPKCCLLVFIDDATSQILSLYFFESETTQGYLKMVERHIKAYGRPIAYYSDKHSIFRTTREECIDRRLEDTQFHRALRELKIELICAHSPQAKGRVERANKTLQDRLIKELRLRGISSMETANEYLPEFISSYNERFGVEAASKEDAHLPVVQNEASLSGILSVRYERKLSKNLEFHFENRTYQIKTETTGYRLRHKAVEICERHDGSIKVWCDGSQLAYKVISKVKISKHFGVDFKQINAVMNAICKKQRGYGDISHA